MAQFERFEYDYTKLMAGDAMPLSQFYVAGVELFTTVPLKAGQRHCRFAYVTRENEWLKTAMFDSIVAADERIALMPQPPLTEAVYKCAQMLTQRLEPVPFIDEHVDHAGPDVLLSQAEQVFGRATDAATPAGLTRVDLLLYNHNLDAHELAAHLPGLKSHLEALPYVKGMCFRNMDLNAGLVTGVLRIFVDAKLALAYKPPAAATSSPVSADGTTDSEQTLPFTVPEVLSSDASVFGEVRRVISAKYTSMEWTFQSIGRNLKTLGITSEDTVLCPDDESFFPVLAKTTPEDAAMVISYFTVKDARITFLTVSHVDTPEWVYAGTAADGKTPLLDHRKDGKVFERWSVRDVLRRRDSKKPALVGIHLEAYDDHVARHARVRTLIAKRL